MSFKNSVDSNKNWKQLTKKEQRENNKKLKSILTELNIKFEGYNGSIDKIKLDFISPEQWVDICNAEGELLPMCCANISSIRDNLFTALRDGGWMRIRDAAETAVLIIGHHDEFEDGHPLNKFVELYDKAKDYMETPVHNRFNPKSLAGAYEYIVDYASEMKWNSLFAKNKENAGDKGRACFIRQAHSIRIALKTILDKLDRNIAPVEIYAIADGEQIYDKSFTTNINEAFNCLDRIKYSPPPEGIERNVVKIRLSMDKGLEFVDKSVERPVDFVEEKDPWEDL